MYYKDENSYLLAIRKEIFKLKGDNNSFPTQFCLGSIPNGFSATDSREVSLNRNVYDFSVDYNSIDESDIINIRKYLMTQKISTKICATKKTKDIDAKVFNMIANTNEAKTVK